jgi:DNA-binding Xre family transcriptional regulator
MTLKEHRHQRHMRVGELSMLSGISTSTIHRIERGRYKAIKPLTIQNLSNALNIPPQAISQFAPFSKAPR